MDKQIKISFPTDENGLVGRECPVCMEYFKIKFGTGIKDDVPCHCPYCKHICDHNTFFTNAQNEYMQSIIMKEMLGPFMSDFERSLKKLEHSTRGGFFQIKVKSSGTSLTIKHYQEKELETHVTCDSCGLEFAIYGVFATCPDCERLNASVVFSKSIEVAKKRLNLIDSLDDIALKEAILKDSISGGISAFDAFGKALREHHTGVFPDKPKNIFQNLIVLSEIVKDKFGLSLNDMLGEDEANILNRIFQVRHIYEHNMGVIDDDFIRKVKDYSQLRGRKYALDKNEIERFLGILLVAGRGIANELEKI